MTGFPPSTRYTVHMANHESHGAVMSHDITHVIPGGRAKLLNKEALFMDRTVGILIDMLFPWHHNHSYYQRWYMAGGAMQATSRYQRWDHRPHNRGGHCIPAYLSNVQHPLTVCSLLTTHTCFHMQYNNQLFDLFAHLFPLHASLLCG